MEKIVTARHFQLFQHVKDHINGRLSELEEKHNKLTSVRVVIDHQKNIFKSELIVHGKRINIEADATDHDIETSFEMAFAKAEKQLRKHFEKMKDHQHTPISQIECELEEEHMNSVSV
ncbi:MAG: ribosome-associated translation inhibitor RaiA [Lentisphaeria bacterium]|nr:ribosome-associated translation inhibitor RaiA [Lentisphaeria bacterium]